MILILSSQSDTHAQTVMRDVRALGGNATLLDLSEYPQQHHLSWHYGNGQREYHLTSVNGNVLDLAAYNVIWWRRPQHYQLHQQLSNQEYQQFAHAEIYEAFTGMWQSLDAFWINDPTCDHMAHRKVYQLRIAQDIGLPIPQTLVTSDPNQARQFVNHLGIECVIYKAFSATMQQWRETRLLKQDELALIDNVKFAPVIFQEYIPAEYDLRITVVGDQIFAAAIHSQETAYKVDMRMDIANARIAAVNLPEQVQQQLQNYMRRLGLIYGAIDMRLTPDGEYVFLEINPAGQWLFIEEKTQQPIAQTMAELMVRMDTRG